VGGISLSDDNAVETADVVNKTNPDFVRIRTFVSKHGTELMEDIEKGSIKEGTDREKVLELKKMIENIQGVDGYLFSDHIINLFEDVKGNMKTHKEEMLSVFEAFERLDPLEQRRYQVARRFGMVGNLEHMELLDHMQKEKINKYMAQLDTDEKFDDFLLKILRHYI
jgi:hypothetical protein